MIWSIPLLLTIIIVLCYVGLNLLKKVEKYEDKIGEYEDSIRTFQNYYSEIKQAIQFSDEKLKIIDSKGTFKSDDEVGYFFTFIQELQLLLNSFDYSKPHIEEKPTEDEKK